MLRTTAILLSMTAALLNAQTAKTVGFEAASVRAANDPRGESIEVKPGSVTIRGASILACVRWAYDVQEYQVVGPSWLRELRFDVFAKSPGPSNEAELRKMMQALLAERFKLALHDDKKELPALILSVSKNGHKLKQVDQEGSPSFQTGKMSLTGTGARVGQLTEFLSHELRMAVIDQTGLTGRYNYFLDINNYVPDELRNAKTDGPPLEAAGIITQAMQEQLGLKVESKKTVVPVLIVDHVEKTPTEN